MTRARGDRGAMSLELALVVPVLLGVLVLVLAYGRQAQVTGLLQAAARDGARTATLARTWVEARQRVGAVVRDTVAAGPATCRDSVGWDVGDAAGFVPGAPVTVRVWCTRTLSDVGLPLPSDVMTRSFTATLDPYRGLR